MFMLRNYTEQDSQPFSKLRSLYRIGYKHSNTMLQEKGNTRRNNRREYIYHRLILKEILKKNCLMVRNGKYEK